MTNKGIKITVLGIAIILILVTALLYFTNIRRITIDASQVNSMKIQSLEQETNGGSWKWSEKEITRKEDIQKVVGFLNSIRYKNMKQEQDFGFGLVIIIKGEKDYTFVFKGSVINVNGINYGTLFFKDKDAHNIYKNFNYKQTDVTNLTK
jgi:hypothetical protein